MISLHHSTLTTATMNFFVYARTFFDEGICSMA